MRKTRLTIAPHLFEQTLCRHAIERGEVGIEHHLLPAKEKDDLLDAFERDEAGGITHGQIGSFDFKVAQSAV